MAAALMAPAMTLAHGADKKIEASTFTPTQLIGKLNYKNKMHSDLGSLAKSQASNAKVRDFGEKLVKDHQQLESDLKTYAKDVGISLADADRQFQNAMETQTTGEPTKSWKAKADDKLDRLRALKGVQFDRQFLSDVSEGSQRMVSFLQDYKAKQSDQKLKGLVDQFITTLRGHQREAEKLQGSLPSA